MIFRRVMLTSRATQSVHAILHNTSVQMSEEEQESDENEVGADAVPERGGTAEASPEVLPPSACLF